MCIRAGRPGTKVKACVYLLCLFAFVAATSGQECSNRYLVPDYSRVLAPEIGTENAPFLHLPGFTRSVYKPNYALVTPESRVWLGNPLWQRGSTSHIISKASGAHFSMYFLKLQNGGSGPQSHDNVSVERFILVLDGQVTVSQASSQATLDILKSNFYAYLPPGCTHTITADGPASLLVYERIYALDDMTKPEFLSGHVEDSPLLDTGIERFALRKLLPQTPVYDFNIHVMDFKPGQHLVVKEVHYNQHGLVLLQGQGIYRLADSWYPVKAGDAIWMAPYVPQWYAALGDEPSRYIIYKDVTIDPLHL